MLRLLFSVGLAATMISTVAPGAAAAAPPDSVCLPAVAAPRLRPLAVAVPLGLISAGVLTMGHRTPLSSRSTHVELREHYGDFRTNADEYLQVLPYAGLAAFALTAPDPRRGVLDNAVLLAKAGAVLSVTVVTLKRVTRVPRPDGAGHQSFPSGHTAGAFMSATLLARQLRPYSRWYGVGAYAVAASVGACRMLNNRHWQSDVLAGAGIGILTARLAHWQHYRARPRRVRSAGASGPVGTWHFAPTLLVGGTPGFVLNWLARR